MDASLKVVDGLWVLSKISGKKVTQLFFCQIFVDHVHSAFPEKNGWAVKAGKFPPNCDTDLLVCSQFLEKFTKRS